MAPAPRDLAALILEAFQAQHGIKVVAISVDGATIPGFADARRDKGIVTTLRVSQVPAMYLARTFTGEITRIGSGVLSESQLPERIDAAASSSQIDPGTGARDRHRAVYGLRWSRHVLQQTLAVDALRC